MKVKVKVPKEIQIGCHVYGVFLKDKTIPEDDASINYLLQDIRIRNDTPPSRRNVVLLHESLHLMNFVFSCRLEEETIEKLSEGLGQLLFSNMGIELDWSDIPTKTATIKEQDKGEDLSKSELER